MNFRIVWLPALLLLGMTLRVTAQEPSPAADSPVLHVYDIGFLTTPVEDLPGRPLAVGPVGMIPAALGESESVWVSSEDLMEVIRNNFNEDSWEDGRFSMVAEGGRLMVVNTAAVHASIGGYLAMLRARRSQQISIDATLVDLSPTAYEAFEAAAEGDPSGGLLVTDKQRAALDAAIKDQEARIVQIDRAIGFYGQRVHVRQSRSRAYVYDYDVQIAEKALVYDPLPSQLEEGTLFDVRPQPEFDTTRVTLEIRYDQQALLEALTPFDAHVPEMGVLHLPAVGHAAMRSCLSLPLGATGVAGMVSVEPLQGTRRCLMLLVSPSAVQAVAAPDQAVESAEKRQLQIFNIGYLTRNAPDFPGPSVEPAPLNGGEVTAGFTFTESVDPGISLGAEAICELVKLNVQPDSWSNARNRIWANENQLYVVHTPEALKAVQAYLSVLAPGRQRMIRVDAILFALTGRLAGAGVRTTALGGGMTVAPQALQALLADSAKGGDLRVVGRAAVAGFNQQQVFAMTSSTRNYISDYDAEIATDSHALDPVVGRAIDGLVLDVRPTLIGDDHSVLLDLRPSLARLRVKPEPFDSHGDQSPRLQLPDLDLVQPRMTLAVKEGEWTVASLAGDAAGTTQYVILIRARVARAP